VEYAHREEWSTQADSHVKGIPETIAWLSTVA
jgi:hypothetical protein